jgi:hypothetical protein
MEDTRRLDSVTEYVEHIEFMQPRLINNERDHIDERMKMYPAGTR